MFSDVVELRDFYATPLGRVAKRLIRRKLRSLWPSLRGLDLIGIGYTTPLMRPFLGEARSIANIMPAAQGVVSWPPDGPGRVCLADECHLPLATESVDRAILLHAVEGTAKLQPMLREVWRVLAGNGRAIVAVASRSGVWARVEETPFGHGRPFSRGQLSRLLRDTLFVPERVEGALWLPPLRQRWLLSGAGAWEGIGERWLPGLGGVILVEVSKQIYAMPRGAEPVRERRPVLVGLPAGQQARSPDPARSAIPPQDEDPLLGE